jgi:predicted small lipoprotein YifL
MLTIWPTSVERAFRGLKALGVATLLLALASVASGCGQKGPLSLPKAPAPAASAPATR